MANPEYSSRGRVAGEENCHLMPARKLQKADRERLRRDHLNEQFAKLAGVLDPIRPKNDKGTILSEGILALKELRAEIARLKSEQIALRDESRDLTVERCELQEEKTLLETETERLEDLRKQNSENLSALAGWKMDHPGVLTSSQYPCPLPVSSMTKSSPPSKDIHQDPSSDQTHHAPDSSFLPAAPFSTFLHPAYQTYGVFGSRKSPFMSYNHYSHPGHTTHVERPAARYPAPIHPTPIYPVKGAQTKSTEPSVVATELQLQTPGLPPSPTHQQSLSGNEQREKRVDRALDVLRDSGIDGTKAASCNDNFAPQLSLSSNALALQVVQSV
ncbi:uncharacterized protein [Physcomitrium patens]|nr:transcription factor bHLH121-like isoform X3 [Physcomitrium patens]|eukprot:XP_024389006.1 transcription factor bHLH121-like isoform X3 [Physcomitrella patens]